MPVRASLWWTVVLLALSSVPVFAQDSTPPRRALDVSATLARRGVSGGVVLCWNWPPAPDDDQPACQPLNAALFQRHEGGVVHVRTIGEPRRVTELLNRRIELEPASGVQAIEAVCTRIVNAVRGDGSAGQMSATGREGQPVEIPGGATTVMEALDQVVRQVPGLVWYLYFEPQDDGGRLTIGLVASQPGGGTGGGGTNVFSPPLPAPAAPKPHQPR